MVIAVGRTVYCMSKKECSKDLYWRCKVPEPGKRGQDNGARPKLIKGRSGALREEGGQVRTWENLVILREMHAGGD